MFQNNVKKYADVFPRTLTAKAFQLTAAHEYVVRFKERLFWNLCNLVPGSRKWIQVSHNMKDMFYGVTTFTCALFQMTATDVAAIALCTAVGYSRPHRGKYLCNSCLSHERSIQPWPPRAWTILISRPILLSANTMGLDTSFFS